MVGWQCRVPLASLRSIPEGAFYSTVFHIMGKCLEHMVLIDFGADTVWDAGKCEHFLSLWAQRNFLSGVETASSLQMFILDIAETPIWPLLIALSEYCPRIQFWECSGRGRPSVASL